LNVHFSTYVFIIIYTYKFSIQWWILQKKLFVTNQNTITSKMHRFNNSGINRGEVGDNTLHT
jgi:hypothetical protein